MKTTPRRFEVEFAAMVAAKRAEIEAQVSGFDPDPVKSEQRRDRAHGDLAFFAHTYFPNHINKPDSLVHEWLYSQLPQRIDAQQGCRLALAAPRGEAKSTIVSRILVLWSIVTRRKWYVCVAMGTMDQATNMLASIKAELVANPRLLMDYPDECGEGGTWQYGVIITKADRKVQVFGSGKQVRGLIHGAHRPDLVIGDDLENDKAVRSPRQRDQLSAWLMGTILYLGAADDSMDLIVVGTILHYDSVLARLLGNPMWEGKRFRAIVAWPHRMDLWERWEEVLHQHGRQSALQFYQERRTEMEEGAVVSWPAYCSLYILMTVRATGGHSAFDSERQNDPASGEDALFAHLIDGNFWSTDDPDWWFYGAVDPSMGRSGKSRDPSAILVGGYNRRTGTLSVVEARISKIPPNRIIDEVIDLQKKYNCRTWVVESVQFQDFLRSVLIERSIARGIPVPAKPKSPTTDKEGRIQSLQPFFEQGRIRLHPSQRTLIQQLRHFPRADHDDGPDALHMLWEEAVKGGGPGLDGIAATGQLRQVALDRPAITGAGWGAVAGGIGWMRGY